MLHEIGSNQPLLKAMADGRAALMVQQGDLTSALIGHKQVIVELQGPRKPTAGRTGA